MGLNTMDEEPAGITETQDGDGNDATKLVPVVESIRYRKRAQCAEKQAETLTEQLATANQKIAQISQELGDLKVERTLAQKLSAAGVIDLEAAVLLAKARLAGNDQAEVDDCVEQLKKDKAYLFAGLSEPSVFRKTAGAKDRAKQTRAALEQAARRAAKTGNRADLQHYLKLRRNLL
jgi:hypothetical protein